MQHKWDDVLVVTWEFIKQSQLLKRHFGMYYAVDSNSNEDLRVTDTKAMTNE